jgi:hypothetical protein
LVVNQPGRCAVSITEYERHQIFKWYEEKMGPERASVMMQLLPPVGWHDVATKADLQALRAELRGEIAELRGEMAELRSELRGEIAELRGEVQSTAARTLRAMVVTMVAGHATLVGLVLSAQQLG